MKVTNEVWGCHSIIMLEFDHPIKTNRDNVASISFVRREHEYFFKLFDFKSLEEVHGKDKVELAKENGTLSYLDTHEDLLIRKCVREKIKYYETSVDFFSRQGILGRMTLPSHLSRKHIIQHDVNCPIKIIGMRYIKNGKIAQHSYRNIYKFKRENFYSDEDRFVVRAKAV